MAAGSEPYGLEAQYFTETKLLQQEVEVILESCNKANNMLIGSVIHPMGNIAEALLRQVTYRVQTFHDDPGVIT